MNPFNSATPAARPVGHNQNPLHAELQAANLQRLATMDAAKANLTPPTQTTMPGVPKNPGAHPYGKRGAPKAALPV
jgi:hypothetical protein